MLPGSPAEAEWRERRGAEGAAPPAVPHTAGRLAEGLTGGHGPNGAAPSAAEELCEEKLTAMCGAPGLCALHLLFSGP